MLEGSKEMLSRSILTAFLVNIFMRITTLNGLAQVRRVIMLDC